MATVIRTEKIHGVEVGIIKTGMGDGSSVFDVEFSERHEGAMTNLVVISCPSEDDANKMVDAVVKHSI